MSGPHMESNYPGQDQKSSETIVEVGQSTASNGVALWSLDEDGKQYVNINDTGNIITYKGRRDYYNVWTREPIDGGRHFIEVIVHKVSDEGVVGLTNDPEITASSGIRILQRKKFIGYYFGRRHKQGDLEDGCASLLMDGQPPQERLFHVADGSKVGLLIDYNDHELTIFLDDQYQTRIPLPPGPRYIMVHPDAKEDCLEIKELPPPPKLNPVLEAMKWCFTLLTATQLQKGDVVNLGGHLGNIIYGPDVQGDLQVIFCDYFQGFPKSGDVNLKDKELDPTRRIMRQILLGLIVSVFMCFFSPFMACQQAAEGGDLSNNVRFKAWVIISILSLAVVLHLLSLVMMAELWKRRFIRLLMYGPTSLAAVAIIIWGATEVELNCGASEWGPMIPEIAHLYAPNGIKPDDLRQYIWVVCFLPWRPKLLLPTMEHSIPSVDLSERWKYFIAEIFLQWAVVAVILEIASRIVKMSQQKPKEELGEAFLRREASIAINISKPAWYSLVFAIWYAVYQVGLYIMMDVMVMCGMVTLMTGPAWEFWIMFIMYICATNLVVGLVTYIAERKRKHQHPSTMLAVVLLPLVGNEIHIFKDHVAGALCFAVAHCCAGDLRTAGLVMGYLSLLSTFIPLAFMYFNPTARNGLPKAHWPIAEAAPPEIILQKSGSTKRGVDASLFGVTSSRRKAQDQTQDDTMTKLKMKVVEKLIPLGAKYGRPLVNGIIPAVTMEKQLRAISGELPHGILHLAFVFIFGGSAFIIFAILISAMKVIMIPVMREIVLPKWIQAVGCSPAQLLVYRKNTPRKYLFTKHNDIITSIADFGWIRIEQALIHAGMVEQARSVEEALLGAAKYGKGAQLKDTFDEWSQETNFVLANAVYRGEIDKIKLLKGCGFNMRDMYSHPRVNRGRLVTLERLAAANHSTTNGKGETILTEQGEKIIAVLRL